jgi:hypothetical protein
MARVSTRRQTIPLLLASPLWTELEQPTASDAKATVSKVDRRFMLLGYIVL